MEQTYFANSFEELIDLPLSTFSSPPLPAVDSPAAGVW